MEFTSLTEIISQLAFPVCCCIYLFWQSAKEREAHKEELNKLTEALNNNTLALTQIKERLSYGKD